MKLVNIGNEWINPAHVRRVYPDGAHSVEIELVNGDKIPARGTTADQIAEKISAELDSDARALQDLRTALTFEGVITTARNY